MHKKQYYYISVSSKRVLSFSISRTTSYFFPYINGIFIKFSQESHKPHGLQKKAIFNASWLTVVDTYVFTRGKRHGASRRPYIAKIFPIRGETLSKSNQSFDQT